MQPLRLAQACTPRDLSEFAYRPFDGRVERLLLAAKSLLVEHLHMLLCNASTHRLRQHGTLAMMRLGRFSFFAACLLLAMRCQQHHMPHDSLNMPYKTSNIAACLGTRSARSQFQHIIIGSSQLGPVTRLLHAPDVAADLLRALSRGFAQMSIQQSGLISYDFVTRGCAP